MLNCFDWFEIILIDLNYCFWLILILFRWFWLIFLILINAYVARALLDSTQMNSSICFYQCVCFSGISWSRTTGAVPGFVEMVFILNNIIMFLRCRWWAVRCCHNGQCRARDQYPSGAACVKKNKKEEGQTYNMSPHRLLPKVGGHLLPRSQTITVKIHPGCVMSALTPRLLSISGPRPNQATMKPG